MNQFVLPTSNPIGEMVVPSMIHNQPSTIDAVLALLLLVAISPHLSATGSLSDTDTDYKSIVSILTYLSAEHPEPSIRTSAHYLAKTLLHNHPSSTFRLNAIKSTLQGCGPFENIKEVAIAWLKDEILFTVPSETEQKFANAESDNVFGSSSLFSEDNNLVSLIFASTTIPSPETAKSPDHSSTPNPTDLTQPIPVLNLLFLLLTNPTLKKRYNLAPKLIAAKPRTPKLPSQTAEEKDDDEQPFETKASAFLSTAQQYVDEHSGKMGRKEDEGKLALLAVAVARVTGALEAYEKGTDKTTQPQSGPSLTPVPAPTQGAETS